MWFLYTCSWIHFTLSGFSVNYKNVFTERFSNLCDFFRNAFIFWEFLQNILENWEPI